MVLPDDYVRAVAAATHAVGGLLVLDCIASGALWVDMTDLGVDVLLSAPQKGWSGSPCAGYVMLGEAGRASVMSTTSTSFAVDLQKWLTITEAYTQGQTPYHATMPTDTLAHDAALMLETRDAGLDELRRAQISLGTPVRAMLAERGFPSVAAEGFAAPSVVVAFTDDPGDPQRREVQAAWHAGGRRRAADVRRRRRLLHLPDRTLRPRQAHRCRRHRGAPRSTPPPLTCSAGPSALAPPTVLPLVAARVSRVAYASPRHTPRAWRSAARSHKRMMTSGPGPMSMETKSGL